MPTDKKVRWGLLSTANINQRLIPAIRASKRGELVAVASRSKATAHAYASKWEIPQAFGDYAQMLASGAVDAVYISLPNHLHAEWSIRALRAGVHVLCEKPMALSLEEIDLMIKASQESGCVLAEAFMYRHHPQTKIAGQWAHSGKLGDLCLFRGVFNFSLKSKDNVRLAPEYGGGCLWDVGVYPLSFAQYIYGEAPTRVAGTQWLGDTGVDETFAGLLEYPRNHMAQIASSFRSPWYTHAEIVGTKGRLTLNRPFVAMDTNRSMVFYPEQGDPLEIQVPEKELYLGEVEDMHAAILDGVPSYISLAETRDHIRTVLGLYESARTGDYVKLD
ncbi:MAG TPA: Gfo/Idh/MocA family oxidoreductase [Anaerolineales bacterium]|nr:Gfo/Idh/MocA family oxidoreductase [Anaerolineales bacterium]